jgi:ADP-ribose pyrophosphatase YjhB (NUDIX family)
VRSNRTATDTNSAHPESFNKLVETHNHDLPDLQPGPHGHPACSDCGRTIWNDPKVAGAAIVPMDGGIVMVQRAIEPAIGKWSFPSGYVNRGEKIENAVQREALEECGLEVEVGRLVGLYSEDGNSIILAVYESKITGGVLESVDHETLDVGVFSPDKLPELAFDHDRGIIADWLKLQGTAG